MKDYLSADFINKYCIGVIVDFLINIYLMFFAAFL